MCRNNSNLLNQNKLFPVHRPARSLTPSSKMKFLVQPRPRTNDRDAFIGSLSRIPWRLLQQGSLPGQHVSSFSILHGKSMAIKPQQTYELQRTCLFWIYTRVCDVLLVFFRSLLFKMTFLHLRYDKFKGSTPQQTLIQFADGSMLSSGNFLSDVSCIQPSILQNEYPVCNDC
jgi:hypothetical protein